MRVRVIYIGAVPVPVAQMAGQEVMISSGGYGARQP